MTPIILALIGVGIFISYIIYQDRLIRLYIKIMDNMNENFNRSVGLLEDMITLNEDLDEEVRNLKLKEKKLNLELNQLRKEFSDYVDNHSQSN